MTLTAIVLVLILIVLALGVRIMSALSDAVARNTASTDALIAAIQNLPSAADVSAAVTGINANSDKLDAAVAAAQPPSA
jgi:hypothetical protein